MTGDMSNVPPLGRHVSRGAAEGDMSSQRGDIRHSTCLPTWGQHFLSPTESLWLIVIGSKQPRIAYAENLENAFKRLETTVGKGGIEGLTGQTTTLLNQQKKLMNNIQGMQPFIKTAESFMSKLDLGGINGMLSKLGGGEK